VARLEICPGENLQLSECNFGREPILAAETSGGCVLVQPESFRGPYGCPSFHFRSLAERAGCALIVGDSQDTSDLDWSGKVVQRFTAYQGQSGGIPDFVLFQSWEAHPAYCLPETDPIAFTGVIDAYNKATS